MCLSLVSRCGLHDWPLHRNWEPKGPGSDPCRFFQAREEEEQKNAPSGNSSHFTSQPIHSGESNGGFQYSPASQSQKVNNTSSKKSLSATNPTPAAWNILLGIFIDFCLRPSAKNLGIAGVVFVLHFFLFLLIKIFISGKKIARFQPLAWLSSVKRLEPLVTSNVRWNMWRIYHRKLKKPLHRS